MAATLLLGASAAQAGDFAVPLAPAEPAIEDSWEFSFTPYGWMPWVELETAGGTEIDLTLGDILDNLNMTAMFEMAVRKGKWEISADVLYVDLGIGLDGRILRKLDISEWLITPRVSYRAWEGDWGFCDIQAGVRYTWVDLQVSGAALGFPIVEGGSAEIWDATIGVRGRYNLNENWYLGYYVEAGAGDSDFIGQFYCDIGYRFKSAEVFFGFRYLSYDFGSGAPLKDETVYGPLLGATFRF